MSQPKCAAAVLLAICGMLPCTEAWAATLTVTVGDLQTHEGQLLLAVWQEANWLGDKPAADGKMDVAENIENGAVTFEFELDAGQYAVTVYQDVNGNGKMDRRFLRPTEPYGFSNDVRPRFAPPKFRDAAFMLGADGGAVQVRLTK